MLTIDLKSLVGKLNAPCQKALEGAAGFCLSRQHYNVEIEHWLIKLLEVQNSDLLALLDKFEIDPGKFAQELNKELDYIKSGNTRAPALSPNIVELTKSAWMLASVDYQHRSTTSAHLLGAMLLDDKLNQSSNLYAGELKKITADALRNEIANIVGSTAESRYNSQADISQDSRHISSEQLNAPSLQKYTVDLTEAARQGKIDAVLGRDEEIRQIIDILIRRRQNNPILTGEAGVGKTAVVEGFALRIASGDVPDSLKAVSILSLDLGLLQAGASVKGEFENRLKSVINEVKASAEPVVLFIDEAHTMIGAGGKEGQGDAANLLKPALARGELRTIAATTWAEYKKYFERDAALTRRFQVVKIEEPDEEKAINMMRAISVMLQKHHGVRILDEAIVDSVKLSSRYITSRQLPDKSVSLLDTACARVSLTQSATPVEIEDTSRRIEQIKTNINLLKRENAILGNCNENILNLENELIALSEKLEIQQEQWNIEKDIVKKIHALQNRIDTHSLSKHCTKQVSTSTTNPSSQNESSGQKPEQNSLSSAARAGSTSDNNNQSEILELIDELTIAQGENPMIRINVDSQAIAEVVANWTGIPIGKMVSDEIQTVLNLKNIMAERIIGQPHALEAIAQNIRTSRSGLTDPGKPVGVFFMVGSSGIGKTETALALADILYGGEQNVTTINMSEFKEEHKVSMLLGSPPGYVGYGEGGVLTEAVRRKPHSVILLDEMEKAHPGVQDIFYNLFDKGTIKDGEGRDIDFRHTVIIMTSNAGEEHIRAICAASDELPTPDVLLDNFRPQLLNHFKPAFLGRTTVIPYYPLSDDDLMKICTINLNKIKKRVLTNYKAEFSYHDDVALHIVAKSREVDTGARNIENILTQSLLPELASECLMKMADNIAINNIHVDVTDEGSLKYRIN